MIRTNFARWYVYDAVTELIYGEPAGFVAQGKDVGGLIKAWHDMFRLGGLIATVPWLIHPLITSWPLRRYMMPQKGQSTGSGVIMSVCGDLLIYQTLYSVDSIVGT